MILPNEIIIRILDISDYRTLLTCMQVCSNFKHLIETSASLQYNIELAISGQLYGYPDSISSSVDRLDRLKKHQSAWKRVKWSRELTVPMMTKSLDGLPQIEFSNGLLGELNHKDQFTFHQLPSDLRGIAKRTWTVCPDLGCSIEFFATDLYQDLLILVEFEELTASTFEHRIYLRSLATGKPHSLADSSILNFPQFRKSDSQWIVHSDCRIFGDLISFLLNTRDWCQAVIWEWKTGRVVLNTYSKDLDAHCILSSQYVVFATTDIDANTILSVVNLKEVSSECQELPKIRLKKDFAYPVQTHHVNQESIEFYFEPGPLYEKVERVPFFQGTNYSTLVVNITFNTDRDNPDVLFHFIPSHYLISLMESGSQDELDFSWISKGTRMFFSPPYNGAGKWVHSTFGTRFVTGELMVDDGKREFLVRLFDFNILALRRDVQRSIGSEAGSGRAEFSSNCLQHWCNPFTQEMETSLPYWRNVAYVPLKDEGADNANPDEIQCAVRCCEDNIVITDFVKKEHRILVF